jgi:hypothetical protein
LNRCIFRSRRLTAWCEFSVRFVLAQTLHMASSHPKPTASAPIGGQPIRHEHRRRIALLLEELAHQPQSSRLVPLRLHQQVQDLALVVDGAPQPQAFAPDHNRHFVEVIAPALNTTARPTSSRRARSVFSEALQVRQPNKDV